MAWLDFFWKANSRSSLKAELTPYSGAQKRDDKTWTRVLSGRVRKGIDGDIPEY